MAGSVKEDDVSSEFSVNDHGLSDVVESELDSESFDAKEWTFKVLTEQGLGGLLRTYNGVLTGTYPPFHLSQLSSAGHGVLEDGGTRLM